MLPEEDLKKRRIDKFSGAYERTQGGIFTNTTRERILTGRGISGRGRTKNQFWYRHRENVKTALIDLQLFTEFAGIDNVRRVMTREALEPIVKALLWYPELDEVPLDPESAEIAKLFIEYGFGYLRVSATTLSHKRTIEEALDLCNYLALRVREIANKSLERAEK